MPALSPTMTEGTLGKWLKKEGDNIEPGDVIAEIETDKATMEFEAVDSGVLAKILISDNTQGVKVNAVIGLIAEDGESIEDCMASYKPESEIVTVTPVVESTQPQVTTTSCKDEKRVFASPLAKKIAQQNDVNLTQITGTGPYGRIVKNDVLSVEQAVRPQQTIQVQQSTTNISTMRKVIAQRLLESKTTIPHFYLTVECEVSNLMSFRQEINENFTRMKQDHKISVNDMVVKAVGLAIANMPSVNASWGGDKIIQNDFIDVSVAVALDDGLITPIVKSAHNKSLNSISSDVKSLVKRAKEGLLRPEEFQGGSITISNLGMYGIDSFLAIINPPQSCILSVGGISQKPIVKDNEICIGNVMSIGISCDHRVIDGALAAQFINQIKLYLENPLALL